MKLISIANFERLVLVYLIINLSLIVDKKYSKDGANNLNHT